MILRSATIKNYRSIHEITFDIIKLDDSSLTFGLIGVNEAGKSSILRSLALKDGLNDKNGQPLPNLKDFVNNEPIEIVYLYKLEEDEVTEFNNFINTNIPSIDDPKQIELSNISLTAKFEKANPAQPFFSIDIIGYSGDEKNNIEEQLKQLVIDKSHKSIFWTAEEKYLISQPINLTQFGDTPDDISVPLRNCFALAGINGQVNIKQKINDALAVSTDREQLENELGEKVTEHINLAWPGHPIKITFDISDGLINFHVHDANAKGKAKTADQRSDGFGQFISFLLTISAQNKNSELSNTLLLLDEPETHLHPTAQEDLLEELIKITRNERNNIAFFATHSNYMIDKNDLSRNYKVSKPGNISEIKQFVKKVSTYASVMHEVFEISSGDYHNQLYDTLRDTYAKSVNKDPDEVGITEFDNGFFQQNKKLKKEHPYRGKNNETTLPTYIRNAIHYPENKNDNFERLLDESIKLMLSYEK